MFSFAYLAVEELVEALDGRVTLLASHEHVDLVDAVARANELLDEHFAQEASGASDENCLLVVEAGDLAGRYVNLGLVFHHSCKNNQKPAIRNLT